MWALCLSPRDTLYLSLHLLAPDHFVLVSFYQIHLPLDIWPIPSYDLALTGDRQERKGTTGEERWVQRRVGWEWAEERFWAGVLFKIQPKCYLFSKVICDDGTLPSSQLHSLSFVPFTGGACHVLPYFMVIYIQIWVSFLDYQLSWGNFQLDR